MLFELATGNLAFRLELEDFNDEFEELKAMLNKVAEKMQVIHLENANLNNESQIIDSSKQHELDLIHEVFEYILTHLEEPLPSTKELSKMFGTNEFTLKQNFRKLLKTSIYQFYNEERLKRAHHLIQQTTISIKTIALMSGFNDYTNFYKSFKKRFGYPPSNLSRGNANALE